MRSKTQAFIANPLVIVLPFVGLIFAGWNQYLLSSRNLNTPSSNILPSGNFDNFNSDGTPKGWQINKSGSLSYDLSKQQGYVGGSSFLLNVGNFKNGNLSVIGEKANLTSNTKYLFKGYYKTNANVGLVVNYFYKDGTSKNEFIEEYSSTDNAWSSIGYALNSSSNISALQFKFVLASDGYLQLDGFYLEHTDHVDVADTNAAGKNIIPNPSLNSSDNNSPDSWLYYHDGNNATSYYYLHENNTPYLRTQVQNYKSGEAKWQYQPEPVQAGQRFRFGVDYRTDAPADLIVEYTLNNNQKSFDVLNTLMPASDWTNIQQDIEVPINAKDMYVSLVLQKNGTLDTKEYVLYEKTKDDAARWNNPVISITFDDGWQSDYDNALYLLDRYNFKATFYVNTSTIETQYFMTAQELHQLQNAGNEIGSHGYSHEDMSTLNESYLDYQLRESRDYLRRAGLTINNFATPYGRSDPQVSWYARKYYNSLRSTEGGLNTKQVTDLYSIKVFYVDKDTPLKDVQAAIDEAKQYNSWLVFVYHQVGATHTAGAATEPTNPNIPVSVFSNQLDLIHNSDISVKTMAQVIKQVQSGKNP
jgi:peptidoglycan/xylan/chitin deacetylase (PgdA/CDA1 family)